MEQEITLVAAAARLHVPWHTAHRWVLTGVLTGDQRDGRWYVSTESVNQKCELLNREKGAAHVARQAE